MRSFLKLGWSLGLTVGALAAPTDPAADPAPDYSADPNNSQSNCKAVVFVANGSAQNRNLTGLPTSSLQAILDFYNSAPFITVSGPQNLAATYCEPLVKNKNNDKLEVLYGSITADRADWSAQGGVGTDFPQYKPEMYSWVRFANGLGYPTLAFDRLGNGKSSHPDPTLVVQAAYEIALYNDIAKQIRAGAKQLGRKYSYLTYIGNSYGSQLGAAIAGTFPSAYNSYILTGYSKNVQQDFAGVSMINPEPAAVENPARFGSLPPGYLTASSQVGRTNSFFGSKQQVSFEDIVAQLFFQREDVVSLGQFASVYAYPFNGKGFKGRVFTLTGEQDQAFCGPGSPVIGPAHCGPLLKDTGVLFPDADYNYQSVDRTGHAIQLHLSAQKVYAIAHAFLAGREFKGGPPA